MVAPDFARELERELAMAGEVVGALNQRIITLESALNELRRFKAAALTLTTLASVQLAMSKQPSSDCGSPREKT